MKERKFGDRGSYLRGMGGFVWRLTASVAVAAIMLPTALLGACILFTFFDLGGDFHDEIGRAARVQPHTPSLKLLPVERGADLVADFSGERQGRREFALEDYWLFVYDRWSSEGRRTFLIPINRRFVTDFASIPAPARSFISPVGRIADGAIVHDWLYAVGEGANGPQRSHFRKEADTVFYAVMTHSNVDPTVRAVVYTAVRLFGDAGYGLKEDWDNGFYDSFSNTRLSPQIGCTVGRPKSAFVGSAAPEPAAAPPPIRKILDERDRWVDEVAAALPQAREARLVVEALKAESFSDADAETLLLFALDAERTRAASKWGEALRQPDCADALLSATKRKMDRLYGLHAADKHKIGEELENLRKEISRTIESREQAGWPFSRREEDSEAYLRRQLELLDSASVFAAENAARHAASLDRLVEDHLLDLYAPSADPDSTQNVLAETILRRRARSSP